MRKLKIAQLSTPFIAVPPPDYGGTELVAYNISEGLVKKGHQVTLFATGDSKTSAKLVAPFKKALFYEDMRQLFSPAAEKLFWLHSLPTLYHAVLPFEMANQFDIIHNHLHYLGLFFGSLTKTPSVHTYHGDLSTAVKSPIERMVLEKYKDSYWTAISETQKKNCPIKLNFVDVIHHGIPLENFTFEGEPEDYLAWLGRITSKKGLKEAILVAKALKKKLIIAGVVHQRDKDYFEKEIKPYIDNRQIVFFGALKIKEKNNFFKKARALLYPISWEEPFGLVMIEAMACGTPVIAFARGAAKEIISDNKTGFLIPPLTKSGRTYSYSIKIPGLQGLIEATKKIYNMDDTNYKKLRANARQRVEKNFTISKMVEKYEKIYLKILNKKR